MFRCLSCAWLVFALARCAGSTQEEQPAVVTVTSAVVPERPAASPPSSAAVFTDDQILGLVATLNTTGIEVAMMGVAHASTPRMKQLAKLLVEEHTQARDEEARVSERLAIRAAPTDQMRTLQLGASREVDQLRALDGSAFDEAWIRDEVKLERDGLAMVDVQLIPSAHIPEMQSHLAVLREQLDHHLRDLSELQRGD